MLLWTCNLYCSFIIWYFHKCNVHDLTAWDNVINSWSDIWIMHFLILFYHFTLWGIGKFAINELWEYFRKIGKKCLILSEDWHYFALLINYVTHITVNLISITEVGLIPFNSYQLNHSIFYLSVSKPLIHNIQINPLDPVDVSIASRKKSGWVMGICHHENFGWRLGWQKSLAMSVQGSKRQI